MIVNDSGVQVCDPGTECFLTVCAAAARLAACNTND